MSVSIAPFRDGSGQVTASNGPEALQVAAKHPGTIDYLLTDVVMPGMLGSELARQLTAAGPRTRVIFMSGYAAAMLDERHPTTEDVVLVSKPFTPAQLLAAFD